MPRVAGFTSPLLLGFEDMERMVERLTRSGGDGYPPYNIERIGADGSFTLRITLAVAGFSESDLDITVQDNQLVIQGRRENRPSGDFLYRGIASRQFQKTFILASGIEVSGATLENGLLAIDLVRPEPEVATRRIRINGTDKGASKPEVRQA